MEKGLNYFKIQFKLTEDAYAWKELFRNDHKILVDFPLTK